MSCWSGTGRSNMSKSSKSDGAAQRGPDNVTEIRKGGYVLAVSGYYKVGGAETALDKMARVLAREDALREIPRTQASNYEESA